MNVQWKGTSVIKLSLSVDSINTFPNLQMTKRTRIARQHKDRFDRIDEVSEGLTPLLYHNVAEDKTILEHGTKRDWYLIYRNHATDTKDALDCFLCASDEVNIRFPGMLGSIVPERLEAGKYYYIIDGTVLSDNGIEFQHSGTNFPVFYLKDGLIHIEKTQTVVQVDTSYLIMTTTNVTVGVSTTKVARPEEILALPTQVFEASTSAVRLNSIEKLDRTDLLLNKVIKLPYCPIANVYDNGVYVLEDYKNWKFNLGFSYLQLQNLNYKFKNTIKTELNPFISLPTLHASPYEDRNDNYETKLYSSAFYQPRFIYDTFVYSFALDQLSAQPKTLNVNFVQTSTINSRSLFDFYELKYKKALSDYPNILMVARNNEEVIYNSPYIDYMNHGYQYSGMNIAMQTITSAVGLGGNLANAGLQFGRYRGAQNKANEAYKEYNQALNGGDTYLSSQK